jgi:acyl dehydratase
VSEVAPFADAGTVQFHVPTQARRGAMTLEAALRYAAATFDGDPAYAEGRATPPLSSALLVLPSLGEVLDGRVGPGVIERTTGPHGEHDAVIHAPVLPDQEVVWDAELVSISTNPAGVLVTARLVVRTPEGQPLVEHLWSTIYPGGTTTITGGDALPDHRFPPEARSRPLGSESISIPADHGETYFLASGDGAPHSRSLDAALAEGHEGMILQGMGSLGIVTAAVVRLVADGDSTRLRRLAVRFSAPVLLGVALEVSAYEVGRLDDGALEVAFEARQGERLCLSHGRATIAPAR